ncbi:MAG: RNA methyltransferase [Pseudomonadota bacterium]
MTSPPSSKRPQRRGASAPKGPRHGPSNRAPAPASQTSAPDGERLYGLHAVRAALTNPARRHRLLRATPNALRRLTQPDMASPSPTPASASASEAAAASAAPSITQGANTAASPSPDTAPLALPPDLAIETVRPADLDRLLGADAVHQGLCLETSALPEPALDALLTAAHAGRPLVVLDQVTDPHNVGAILRSAAVFNAGGLIMTRRHSPPLTATLAKAASGAVDLVPVLYVQNLARTLTGLGAQGVNRIAFEGDAPVGLHEVSLARPLALVLGAEGRGLRRLTRDVCDEAVHILSPGTLASLNVSNAAAIALHAAALARR